MTSDPSSQPTQPLTDAELARIDKICEGGWTPAGLDQGRLWVTLTRHREANQVLEQAAILAVQTKDEAVAEAARLRAENTAQAERIADAAEIHRPTGLVEVGVEDYDHCLNCDQVWPCATRRALGLDQDGSGQ